MKKILIFLIILQIISNANSEMLYMSGIGTRTTVTENVDSWTLNKNYFSTFDNYQITSLYNGNITVYIHIENDCGNVGLRYYDPTKTAFSTTTTCNTNASHWCVIPNIFIENNIFSIASGGCGTPSNNPILYKDSKIYYNNIHERNISLGGINNITAVTKNAQNYVLFTIQQDDERMNFFSPYNRSQIFSENVNVPCGFSLHEGIANLNITEYATTTMTIAQNYFYKIYLRHTQPKILSYSPSSDFTASKYVKYNFSVEVNDPTKIKYTEFFVNGELNASYSNYMPFFSTTFYSAGAKEVEVRYTTVCDDILYHQWNLQCGTTIWKLSGYVYSLGEDYQNRYIANARIVYRNQETGSVYETFSKTDGYYEFFNVENGNYTIFSYANGYQNYNTSYRIYSEYSQSLRKDIIMNSTQQNLTYTFGIFEINNTHEGSLYPLQNFQCKFFRLDDGKLLVDIHDGNINYTNPSNFCLWVDDETKNTFNIYNLQANREYKIECNLTGFVSWMDGQAKYSEIISKKDNYIESIIFINETNLISNIEIVMDIYDENYTVLSYSTATIFNYSKNVLQIKSSGSGNTIYFSNISEGEYYFKIEKNGYLTYEDQYPRHIFDTEHYDFFLQKIVADTVFSGTITSCYQGTITYPIPLENSKLTFTYQNYTFTTKTDAQGRYQIFLKTIPLFSEWHIKIEKEGYNTRYEVYTITETTSQSGDNPSVQKKLSKDFCLDRNAEYNIFTVQVLEKNTTNTYINDAKVYLFNSTKNIQTMQKTVSNGKTAFVIPSGLYYVQVKKDEYLNSEIIEYYVNQDDILRISLEKGIGYEEYLPFTQGQFTNFFNKFGWFILFILIMSFIVIYFVKATKEIF